MATERISVLDERSLRWVRRELRRQVQAALHQLGPTPAWTWRPGGGAGGGKGALIPFELKYDLDPGDTSTAYMMTWDFAGNKYISDDTIEIDVRDTIGKFRGMGRKEKPSPKADIAGFHGWAKHGAEGWEIVYLERGVTMFIGTIDTEYHAEPDCPNYSDTFVTPATEEIHITAYIESVVPEVNVIFQATGDAHEGRTTNAPWYTSDGESPDIVFNTLGLYQDIHRKGEAKMWWGCTTDIPYGWYLMDGSSNSNGSGIDMKDRFARGVTDSGALGDDEQGADTHTHTTGSSYTGIHEWEVGEPEVERMALKTPDILGDPGHSHTVTDGDNIPVHQGLKFIEYIPDWTYQVLCVWNDQDEQYEAVKFGKGGITQT